MGTLVMELDLIEDQVFLSFPGGGFGQNVLICGIDMSFSAHIDNKKDKLIFGIELILLLQKKIV